MLIRKLVDIEVKKAEEREKRLDSESCVVVEARFHASERSGENHSSLKSTALMKERDNFNRGSQFAQSEDAKETQEQNRVSIKSDANLENSKLNEHDVAQNKKLKTVIMGKSTKKLFTQEEDKIIHKEIKTYGENINYSELAKKLKRNYQSVKFRADKVRSGEPRRKIKQWTLVEDRLILDRLIEKSVKSDVPLTQWNLPNQEWKCLGRQFDRRGVHNRWHRILKPWLLQYFHGTLNFNIDTMLANYIADHFDDINSINWSLVLLRKTARRLNMKYEDITPRIIAEAFIQIIK